jgi:tyrosine decarboxylase/aspartate 1-decarboxylase
MAQEFDRHAPRDALPMPDPLEFPEDGQPESEVIGAVQNLIADDPFSVERNFGITYVGPPHPIADRVATLTRGTYFVEWAREMVPSAYSFEKEAVRMMASLLGQPEATGFITSGGTESNMSAMRLARNLAAKSSPEIIMPTSAHYSFRLGAELLGINLIETPVDDAMRPDMDAVRRAITPNTAALICSAPEGNFGQLDPVPDFAQLARDHGLYLHVDGAFGGFILPFMRDLGHDLVPFDLSVPGVDSFMTDGHKLGMLPVATGFFLIRDAGMLEAIPVDTTFIHTLTATKPGTHAATAWAVMRHLGRAGYRASVEHLLESVQIIVDGIEDMDDLQLMVKPLISVINFTSDSVDMERVFMELSGRGWGTTFGEMNGKARIRLSLNPHRDHEHAHGFLAALRESVRAAR